MVLSPHPFNNFTKIDFDDVPDETVIDNHYSNKGVRFESITTAPPKQWSAYARQHNDALTAPNIVSVHKSHLPLFDALDGGVQATFHKPQRFVSIGVRATVIDEFLTDPPLARPFLMAFNYKGAFLPPTQYYPFVYGDAGWGNRVTLSFLATSAEIGKVVFSCQIANHRVYGLFDHLVFSEDIPYFPPIPLGPGGAP